MNNHTTAQIGKKVVIKTSAGIIIGQLQKLASKFIVVDGCKLNKDRILSLSILRRR